jgi:hypothetical protein
MDHKIARSFVLLPDERAASHCSGPIHPDDARVEKRGKCRATPIAGAGHQASSLRETAVTVLLGGGSLAIVVAMALVLWGLCVWKA